MIKNRSLIIGGLRWPELLRRVLLSWLLAATVEFLLLPGQWRDLSELEGLAQMSLLRVLLLTAGMTVVLSLFSRSSKTRKLERWCIPAVFAVLATVALCAAFTWAFFVLCLLLLTMFVVFALFGWNKAAAPAPVKTKEHPCYLWITVGVSVAFALFVSAWLVSRVVHFRTPTYDFGLFAQMFYHMKANGLPLTTLERDGLLSHFAVHVSPIWYLLLPVYWLFPYPATLQVMQAVVLASAVVPLWLLGEQHGLSPAKRMLLCLVLLLMPSYAAGTGYDIHENCFLTPLILWLLYGIDRKNITLTMSAAVLTLMVKEDAAVYVAVIALWLVVKTLLKYRKKDLPQLLTGLCLLLLALGWFFATTTYLATKGDGVMTNRYKNFMYDGSGSLITVIKAVIMNPGKALYECMDSEKLGFIALTLLPLLGLPLITRRYERYILLIPYILINLMSDYEYQHDIKFQYTFGTTALLVYLALVNLADLKFDKLRLCALGTCLVISICLFGQNVVPTAIKYPKMAINGIREDRDVRKALNAIPPNASVTATTFYTTYLSQREVLYDVRYCTREHLLETEYVALQMMYAGDFMNFNSNGENNGFENLKVFLQENGYEEYRSIPGTLVIYRKQIS